MGDDEMGRLYSYICPSCGGHLDTDDSRKLMICRSCGNTYDYDYFSGENLLKAADKALAHNNFSAAKDMYSFMLDKEPSNVKALTGLLLANNNAKRLYDITQKIKDGTFSAAGFDLVKYKDTADPEVLTFFEKTDRILALYKEYIALKKDLKRLEAEKKESEPEISEPGGGLFSYASEKTLKTTVVVASGNENENVRYSCLAHLSTPIVVGAINDNNTRAGFSNYGSTVDVAAPGVDIISCWLDNAYAIASGTSMAAPHISAVAAMHRLMRPTYSADQIHRIVRYYVKDIGKKGWDNYFGTGIPYLTKAISPNKVTLNRTTATLQVKKTLTLKATISPACSGLKNKLTWYTSNKAVVTVSGGKLTARKKGTATITVKTGNGKKATCKVTVTD